MRHTKNMRYAQAGWAILLTALMLSLLVTPVSAASSTARHAARRVDTVTYVGAKIYLATSTLSSLFQSRIEQQAPAAFNSTINNLVSTLPKQDQSWVLQMATTLIQPSAMLTRLTPETNGLATSLRISLYPGDPHPINTSMLVSLNVLDSSTVQVSAQPIKGSPALVSGPIATFNIPLGQLNSINMTPTCGDAALVVKLQFPVALGHAQPRVQQNAALNAFTSLNTHSQELSQSNPDVTHSTPSTSTSAYIELPASSLASMGNSVGNLPINSNTTAKNVNIRVRGSNLVINADIYDSFWGKVGTATTTVAPTAAGGSLAVKVLSTTITVLDIFTFPYDSYNQQIQQTLNSKLNGALAGKFNVTRAAIGPNAQLPCAASDSLVLTGSASLG